MNTVVVTDHCLSDLTTEEFEGLLQTAIKPPFFERGLLLTIAELLNASARVALFCGPEPLAALVYLLIKKKDARVLVTRGRFGFLGLTPLKALGVEDQNRLSGALRQLLLEHKVDTASVVLEPYNSHLMAGSRLSGFDYCSSSGVFNCDLFQVYDRANPFSKPQHMRSRSIPRGLKRGREHGYQVLIERDSHCLQAWYDECHIPRMREIDGDPWGFEFLRALWKNTNVVLYSVYDRNRHRAGGCVAVESVDATELFMMSTPSEHVKTYANYVLTNYIYEHAFQSGRRFVNWQASNPPEGGVADYKKKWHAFPRLVPTYCYQLNCRFFDKYDRKRISEAFPETYVYPFEAIPDTKPSAKA